MSDDEYDFETSTGLTSVLLGFAGKTVQSSETDVFSNFIGGSPVWLRGKPPSTELLLCGVCGKETDLLAQLNCPLPAKDYDRILYIFACADPNCRRKKGSVRAIRGVESNDQVRERIKQESEEALPEKNLIPPQGNLGDVLFGSSISGEANPFGKDTESSISLKPSKNNKGKKNKKKKEVTKSQGRYPCKILEVEDEFLAATSTEEFSNIKIEDAEADGVASSEVSSSGADILGMEMKGDPLFAQFVNIVQSNPEQVLRYERGLKPLLYSGEDGVPEELSSLTRHMLELQLMPHLISELETADMIADGMEWGTIYVATDASDAPPVLDSEGVGYTEEWVAVQWETLRS